MDSNLIFEKLKNVNVRTLFDADSKKRAVKKYATILQTFSNTNVATNRTFQKTFNGFYRVRRNQDWQKIFYSIMEAEKEGNPSFEEIIRNIYLQTGRIEVSFASKLLHTLNNNMPILDQFVLENLGIKLPYYGNEEKRLANGIAAHQTIVNWYKNALSMYEINQKLLEFDELFPEYKWFSQAKKLDFLLWQMR